MVKATGTNQAQVKLSGFQWKSRHSVTGASANGSDVTQISGASPASSAEGTSLRRKLLLTILPVILVPLMLAGAMGLRIVGQRSQEQVQEQLANQALLTSEGATAVIEELLTIPQTIADSPLVINEAVAGGLNAEAEGLSELPIDVLEERFQDTRLLRQHKRLNEYLQETVETADIAKLLVTERHGFNVAASEVPTDFVQSDETWWQNGKEQGIWIGSPDFDFAAKGYTVEFAQAITDPNTQEFYGVVMAVLPTRKFSLLAQYIKRTGISGSQQVQLIDGASLKVIDSFSTEGFQRSREIVGDQPIEALIGAFLEVTRQQEDPQVILQALRNGSPVEQVSVRFADEAIVVASFTHGQRQYKLTNIPNTQWVALATMDKAEISAAGRDSLMFLALTTMLLAGLTTLLILWLARQLSAPLDSLAAQAQTVAAGDFNVMVTPTGTQETRTLTQSFNQLVVQVKDLLRQQEQETRKAQLFAAITGASANTIEDLKPILEQALPQAQSILKADRVMFYPLQSEPLELLAVESVRPNLPPGFQGESPTDCIPDALFYAEATGSPLVIDDIAAADLHPELQAYLQSLKVRSLLAMPVFNEDGLFGALLVHRSGGDPWQATDKEFIALVAEQLRLVIDRVTALRKIKESRQVAAVLTDENQQQTLQINQTKEQLAQQNEELRRHQAELSQQSEEQRLQKEQLQHQIATLVEDIQGVYQGDLTVRAQVTEGELKTVADIFNLTVAKLQDLVSQIQQSSSQVNKILAQNQETAVQLTSATLGQAQEAEETKNTLQLMIDSIGVIAESATLAAVNAKAVAETAQASETGMIRTYSRVIQLNDASSQAISQMESLGQNALNLNQVTATIRELGSAICQQLDYLQNEELDAAERQRFDAVAQEIKIMTEKTIGETEQLDLFLQTLQQTTKEVVSALKLFNSPGTATAQMVWNSKQGLEEVARLAQQFDQWAQSISTETFFQSHTSKSVFKLVKEVVDLSAQTVTFSQKIEKTLHKTGEIAQGLQESVSTFKVDAH